MSKVTIAAKNLVIRNETQDYANTNGRVADVLDDINNSKPDTEEVGDMIEEALEDYDLTTKINKPNWNGVPQYYIVRSDVSGSNNNLQEISLSNLRIPYWNSAGFSDSPLFVSSDALRVGIGAASVSEKLEVSGNVKATALILPANGSSAIANRLRSDGGTLYFSNNSSIEKPIMFDEAGVFVGSVIPLNLLTGNYQVSSANNATAYTLSNLKRGGWAIILINSATEPTVSGATKIAGSPFILNTNMYMLVRNNGVLTEYFFARI